MQGRFPASCLAPGTRLRIANGPAYCSSAFVEHAQKLGFDVDQSQIRTPENSGVMENIHAGLDRDYLNCLVFDNINEAREHVACALPDYNHAKPKKRLNWKAPTEYRDQAIPSAN